MKYLSICLFISVLFISCDFINEDNPESEYMEGSSSVLKQSVLSKTNSSVTFKIIASKPSSCGNLSRTEISIVDSTVFVKAFFKHLKSASCLAVVSSYEAEVSISNLPYRNNYHFKFWVSDSTTKDTTVAL